MRKNQNSRKSPPNWPPGGAKQEQLSFHSERQAGLGKGSSGTMGVRLALYTYDCLQLCVQNQENYKGKLQRDAMQYVQKL